MRKLGFALEAVPERSALSSWRQCDKHRHLKESRTDAGAGWGRA